VQKGSSPVRQRGRGCYWRAVLRAVLRVWLCLSIDHSAFSTRRHSMQAGRQW
jgi:hypothetical protein